MMAVDKSRYENDGNVDYSRAERDALQVKLDAVDEAKDLFLLEVAAAARKYGQAIEAADPKFVLWNGVERGHEAIQGFVEHVQAVNADLAGDLKDHEEISTAEQVVETGRG